MTPTDKLQICFVDPRGWDYGIDTPYERPLGGSQSALCYLAEHLCLAGHEVTIFNDISLPAVQRGVECRRISDLKDPTVLEGYDSVICLNGDVFFELRRGSGTRPITVLWTQHADNDSAVQFLKSAEGREKWDYFAFVSEWQMARYCRRYGLDPNRSVVKRNAISPCFERISRSKPWFDSGRPPILAYTSTPFRGLDVLLLAFPTIREAFPGATLRVISSMGVYQCKPENDRFEFLYKVCRAMDGVEYIGSLSQKDLATTLSTVSVLAYPSTFPKTSCISVMEAMGASCLILTGRVGALPETLADFGFLLTPRDNMLTYARDFSAMAVKVLRDVSGNREKYRALLNDQIAYARENLIWRVRAQEWVEWLSAIRRC